jgi:serine/threonine protein kinase
LSIHDQLEPSVSEVFLDPSAPPEARFRLVGRIARTPLTETHLGVFFAADGMLKEMALVQPAQHLRRQHAFIAALERESQRMARLQHPNVLRVREVGTLEGALFIAYDQVAGVTLDQLRSRLASEARSLPLAIAIRIAIELLAALEHAHASKVPDDAQGVLHLGLSPSDVTLAYDGAVLLSGFGMAAARSQLPKDDPARREANAYESPEQIEGIPVDARSDLYSLSEVLFELMLERHSFPDQKASVLASAMLAQPPSSARALRPSFPEPIDAVLMKGLARSVGDRFQDAAEMRAALSAAAISGYAPVSREALGWFVRDAFKDRWEAEQKARLEHNTEALARSLKTGGFDTTTSTGFPALKENPAEDLVREVTLHPQALQQSSSIRVNPYTGGPGLVIRLSGEIDKKFNRRSILEQIKPESSPVVFDLEAIDRITSYGVREWTTLLRELPPDYYCFVRVPPVMVAQFNMVSGFGGTGELITMFAPYTCVNCGADSRLLIDLRTQRLLIRSGGPREIPCSKCGEPAEFDDVPESYFAYALSAAAPTPPQAAVALIDGAAEPGRKGVRVRKEVDDSVTALWFSGALDENARFKRIADDLERTVVAEVSQLHNVNAEGTRRFIDFLTRAPVSIHLARATPHLLLALEPFATDLGQGKLLSARLPFRCPLCSWTGNRDVEGPFDTVRRAEIEAAMCTECMDSQLTMTADPGVYTALSTLPESDRPPDAVGYLARHIEAPKSARSQGDIRVTDLGLEAQETIGKYQLIKKLGRGGMAEVFLAKQIGIESFEKRVALKRILPQLVAETNFVEMFLREARVAARLSHPNVVQIFDLGKVNDQYFLAMEYVRGWDLSKILGLCSRLMIKVPVEFACRIAADVCAGLSTAHNYQDDEGNPVPIIHRDVSPHNVLISTDGVAKLTDFGIAKATDSASLTRAGEVRGKISYLAPERVHSDVVDARSDIFSTGIVLHETLTLTQLFKKESRHASISSLLHDPIVAPSVLRPDVPADVDAIVMRALDRDPERRFPTAQSFQLALEHALTRLPQSGSAGRFSKWLRAVFTKGVELGEIATDVSFTPTSGVTHEIPASLRQRKKPQG